MTLACQCGGRYKRIDIEPVWSEAYKKFLYKDSDPLVAHWSCDRCGAPRTQRKRQAKAMNKTIYTKNSRLWESAVSYAEREGISVSELIERALWQFLEGPDMAQRRLEEIRRILAEKT